MLLLVLRYHFWEEKKGLVGLSQGCRGMRQCCHIVLGKILHYAERCAIRCVVMVQPPIVSDGWMDTKNVFSQSCEDFPYKSTIFQSRHILVGLAAGMAPGAAVVFHSLPTFSQQLMSFKNIRSIHGSTTFGLAIHQNDHQARRRFVEWAQNEIAVVPDFHKRILVSDEAYFWLNGYVNKQNCRIWSEANPQVDEGHNVTVNGDRYRASITNFFIPELNNHDVQEQWFQQDGATCHTARATIDLLKDTFGGRLISRFGPVNWPPRSCDLTPLDYFLWGYVKSLIYADKPQTLDHLEDNIRRVISDIWPQMLEKVIENWTTSEPAVVVLCQKSYLKCNATRLSFE
ncbi:uncharacterized protein TNCV_2260301 [Trichonephila clavipes]|nr:uncharacterized protein TNCV_2260301 [Trichonephila clavipes]